MASRSESRVFCQIVDWGYSRPSLMQTVIVLLVLCGFALAGQSLGTPRIVVLWVVVVLALPITFTVHVIAARVALPEPPLACGLSAPSPQLAEQEEKVPPKTMSAGQGS